jgi:predicted RNA-binding protein with TRAM domain
MNRPIMSCFKAATRVLAIAVTGFAISVTWVPAAHADAPSPATNTCAQSSVAGHWDVNQQGDHFTMDLTQTGSAIAGTAEVNPSFTGVVSGTVTGNTFQVVISWTNGTAGNYTATVSPGHLSDGSSVQVGHPENTATWSATGGGGCSAPTSKDQCKNGGWSSYGNPMAGITAFVNQGDCVSYVASRGNSDTH